VAIAAALISCSLTQAQVVPGGSEFQVNTYTTAYQYDAAVVAGENGGFVVVWESDYQDGWGYSVQGRRYLVNGSAASGEFQVRNSPALEDLLDRIQGEIRRSELLSQHMGRGPEREDGTAHLLSHAGHHVTVSYHAITLAQGLDALLDSAFEGAVDLGELAGPFRDP
jgi:hypothetical protein